MKVTDTIILTICVVGFMALFVDIIFEKLNKGKGKKKNGRKPSQFSYVW